jgi:hypothetical protein
MALHDLPPMKLGRADLASRQDWVLETSEKLFPHIQPLTTHDPPPLPPPFLLPFPFPCSSHCSTRHLHVCFLMFRHLAEALVLDANVLRDSNLQRPVCHSPPPPPSPSTRCSPVWDGVTCYPNFRVLLMTPPPHPFHHQELAQFGCCTHASAVKWALCFHELRTPTNSAQVNLNPLARSSCTICTTACAQSATC